MCHTITQRKDKHFLELVDKPTGLTWFGGFKRFITGRSGVEFMYSHAAPEVTQTETGLEISCQNPIRRQPLLLHINTTSAVQRKITATLLAGMHVAPIEEVITFSDGHLNTVVLFKQENIVFLDRENVSVKRLFLPRDFWGQFELIDDINLGKVVLDEMHKVIESQFQNFTKAMEN